MLDRLGHGRTGFQDYENERLEQAARIALSVRAISYKSLRLILQNQQDKRRLPENPVQLKIIHSNLRGASAFSNDKEEEHAHTSL
jgi:hypothetical protein